MDNSFYHFLGGFEDGLLRNGNALFLGFFVLLILPALDAGIFFWWVRG
jgi:hypothetical protein